MSCRGDIERLDSELAALARAGAALRLRLGQLLEVLSGGHGAAAVFELGFSSLGAYVAERCERSARWAEGARGLARRLEVLPELRRAVAVGSVSWSMAEVLARVATPEDEARWLEQARSRTVRQVRLQVAEAMAAQAGACGSAGRAPGVDRHVGSLSTEDNAEADGGLASSLSAGADQICTLTCTVDLEDAWLFEATRCLLEQLGERSAVEQADALLAEAQTTLLALLPHGSYAEGVLEPERLQGGAAAQRSWLEQLQRWRAEAEVLCEKNALGALLSARAASAEAAPRARSVAIEASLGMVALQHVSATALDGQVRTLSGALATHDLEVSRLALRFHRADGWRRLGYASEAQYARERLGVSRSSLRARRTLALRLERLPRVAAALAAAHIGVEAASQLVRVATAKTEAAWIERARRRTIKHLREEVAAALVAVRLSGEADCPPPADAELAAFQTLEQAVLGGQFARPRAASAGVSSNDVGWNDVSSSAAAPLGCSMSSPAESTSEERKAWWEMLGGLAAWIATGCQVSAMGPSLAGARRRSLAGRVTLRLRMSREAYVWWRGLEAQARRWLPTGMSWLRFLCLSVWHGWSHLLGADVAYGHIYVRDRYQCTSPVCSRRDVTPHHLRFRSAGGSDDDDNVASLCTWCHLHGVHGGRIRARGPVDHIHWELGPRSSPSLIVHRRERMGDHPPPRH